MAMRLSSSKPEGCAICLRESAMSATQFTTTARVSATSAAMSPKRALLRRIARRMGPNSMVVLLLHPEVGGRRDAADPQRRVDAGDEAGGERGERGEGRHRPVDLEEVGALGERLGP